MSGQLRDLLVESGLIAILRGIQPAEVCAVADVLYTEGFRVIEVPLNSPQALESIRILRGMLPNDCVLGAGTVLTSAQVIQVRDAGANLIIMPHSDTVVIHAAMAVNLEVLPGVATPNEAFGALGAGLSLLKVFPADHLGPAALKAWLAVLPKGTGLIPVGGIHLKNLGEFIAAGATALGIGSALYKSGSTKRDIAVRANQFMAAWNVAKAERRDGVSTRDSSPRFNHTEAPT